MNVKKTKVVMLGSIPMSLSELALAPAIISSRVKKKGYRFEFIDINLDLFEFCNKDYDQYYKKAELLQNLFLEADDPQLDIWEQRIIDQLTDCSHLLINVFSYFSQGAALRFIRRVRNTMPHVTIAIGGIGSQKIVASADNSRTRAWVDDNFTNTDSIIFGQLLLNNGLIDSWQTDTTTSELDRILTDQLVPKAAIPDVDFSIYRLDSYQWSAQKAVPILGSVGCVRQCSFCDVIKHYPTYEFVEADQLTKQITEIYQQTQIGKFIFMDSLVNGSMKNFENLLANLAHSRSQGWLPDNFSWSGTYICRPPSTQLDRIHELLPGSGVDTLVIGVETGSDRVRFEMDKKFTNDDLLSELEAFKTHGVKSRLLFFSSWPTETDSDFKNTLVLFKNLAQYAQQYSIDSVNLGTSGFGLLDGSPIELNKEAIGLEAGPTQFLWHCRSNPKLTFWEAIRRRLLMAAVCEYYGIKLDNENEYRRYLALDLNRHRNTILDYSGPLTQDIFDTSSVLKTLNNQHRVKISIVNSGNSDVVATLGDQQHCCRPGVTVWEFTLTKVFDEPLDIDIQFKFDNDYQPVWDQYDSGDYYSKTGLYLDGIQVDYRDITLWGFNQITQSRISKSIELPVDYYQHQNLRCIVADSTLTWNIPANTGLQTWILNTVELDCQERQAVNVQLVNELTKYQGIAKIAN